MVLSNSYASGRLRRRHRPPPAAPAENLELILPLHSCHRRLNHTPIQQLYLITLHSRSSSQPTRISTSIITFHSHHLTVPTTTANALPSPSALPSRRRRPDSPSRVQITWPSSPLQFNHGYFHQSTPQPRPLSPLFFSPSQRLSSASSAHHPSPATQLPASITTIQGKNKYATAGALLSAFSPQLHPSLFALGSPPP
jgi:hypothetical protein